MSSVPKKKRERGFTLLEFGVVAVILGVVAATLLHRLLYYQEMAEKVQMDVVAGALKNALRVEMANQLMAGRRIDYDQLRRENPMNWLSTKPPNYRGEVSNIDQGLSLQDGWYFDLRSREIVYLVNSGRYFQPDNAGKKRVRYSVRPIQNRGVNGQFGIATVDLIVVEPYRWF